MCGIVGFNGTNNLDPLKIKILFLYNESRGKDSCGIYANTADEYLFKVEGEASKKLLPSVSIPVSNVLIGHTRMGTVGLKNKENAHPFKFDSIVGVHNGKIDNWISVLNHFDIPNKDINVDSQSIFASLAKVDDPSDVIKQLEGAMAIVWSDTHNPDRIYCYRNIERTLFRGTIRGEGMYISSMDEALKAIECSDIKEFKPNYLYTIEEGVVKSYRNVPHKKKPEPSWNKHHHGANSRWIHNPNWSSFNHDYAMAEVYAGIPDEQPPFQSKLNLDIVRGTKTINISTESQVGSSEGELLTFINNSYLTIGNAYNPTQQKPIVEKRVPAGQTLSDMFPELKSCLIKINNVVEIMTNNPKFKEAQEKDKYGTLTFLDSIGTKLMDIDVRKDTTSSMKKKVDEVIADIQTFIEELSKKLIAA